MELDLKIKRIDFNHVLLAGQLMVVIGSSLITLSKVVLGQFSVEGLAQSINLSTINNKKEPPMGGGYFEQ